MKKRSILVLAVMLLGAFWLHPRTAEPIVSLVYPLSIKGKVWQTDIAFGPGFKVGPGKVNDKILAAVLRQELPDFAADFLNLDPGGHFFLFFDGRGADGRTTWRVATNDAGTLATTLTGIMTQDGIFFLSGSYSPPGLGAIGSCFLTGKAKFAKGTFNPTKISGTCSCLLSSAGIIGEGFTVKFKTAGGPLI
jgi:hypothetical protein